jgi:toluene monooxygenase electron transfer component
MSYRIVEERLGATFECAYDDVLLRAGLRVSLPLAYECNAGGCGNCKFELLKGVVDDLWPSAPGLSPRDRGRGRRLACQSRPLSDCRIKMVGRGEATAAPVPARHTAKLVGIENLTHDMREFRFQTWTPAQFLPGQYALLSLGDGAPRAYSMSNVSNDIGEWHFIIRRVPGGAVSSLLFGLAVGAQVALDGPYGKAFLRPEIERSVVCIAGGSGLSPMIGIARGLDQLSLPPERTVDFFYGGRSAEDICGEALLRDLPRLGRQVRFHPIVSNDSASWSGRVGMVHELVADLPTEAFRQAEFYLAGPPPMAEAVVSLLTQERAVPADRIHYDRFF